MLQTFRNHLLGWFAKILIGLISLAFAMFGIEYYLVNSRTNQSIATVNGVKITPTQLTTTYNRNRDRLISQFGSKIKLTPEKQVLLRKQSLDELITREIIYQGAKKAGFIMSPLAVQATIEQMPIFQVDGQFSYDRMQRILYNLSYTDQSFYDEIARAMTAGQLSEGILQSAFALSDEIDRTYAITEQKRDFQVLVLPIQQFEREIQLSDAVIKAYYDAHKNQYQSEAQLSLDYVELNINDLKAKQTATDHEIQEYYQNNLSTFSAPARWQVAKVIIPFSADANEKEVADAKAQVKLLADQLKQKSKADLKTEWIAASQEHKDFVKLFSGLKVGDLTEPQQQSQAWVVYKLLAVEMPKPQALTAVLDKVKDAVLKQKVEKDFMARADQLSELAFTHPDSLTEVSKDLGLTIQSTGSFTRQGATEGLASSPKVVSAAYSDEVLQQSSNSNPIDLGNGRIVVVRLKSSQPAHLLPLENVKNQITAVLKRQQAIDAMTKLGISMVSNLREGKSIDDQIKTHQLRWQSKSNVGREDKSFSPELIQLVFRAATPKNNGMSYDGAPMLNGDFAIVGIQKVILGDPKSMTKKERIQFQKSIAFSFGLTDFNFYVKDLREKATVNQGTIKAENNKLDAPDD